MFVDISKDNPVIAWWSGGGDSAWTCYLCLKWFGKDNVRVVFIDTRNEGDDTQRFKKDCEDWYGVDIETISSTRWDKIQDIWRHYGSLNVATGAICSTVLKRMVRQDFQNKNNFSYQAFGYDITEIDRCLGMKINNPDSKPIFPVVYELMDKGASLKAITKLGIQVPTSYKKGYHNNNCEKTGCVKGGIGYWQKRKIDYPDEFEEMAALEHELTDANGYQTTICKDQSKEAKKLDKRLQLVFLKPHPGYANNKDLSMMTGRHPEPLMECNGFCGPKIIHT